MNQFCHVRVCAKIVQKYQSKKKITLDAELCDKMLLMKTYENKAQTQRKTS